MSRPDIRPDTRSLSYVPLPEPGLLRRICVAPPYYALRAPRLEGDVLVTDATAELPAGFELGPMGGAEVSRHGAIAGLCRAALAQHDDRRRFYLAQRAAYRGFPNPAPRGTPVRFRAELVSLDRRSAEARVVASADALPLAELRVGYTILTASAFERLFRAHRRPTERFATLAPPESVAPVVEGATATRLLDPVPLSACAGHFDDHPALPVAFLMHLFSDLGGRLLDRPFWGLRCSVEATDLCWAGQPARFELTRLADEGEAAEFEGRVVSGGRTTCRMRMALGAS